MMSNIIGVYEQRCRVYFSFCKKIRNFLKNALDFSCVPCYTNTRSAGDTAKNKYDLGV